MYFPLVYLGLSCSNKILATSRASKRDRMFFNVTPHSYSRPSSNLGVDENFDMSDDGPTFFVGLNLASISHDNTSLD